MLPNIPIDSITCALRSVPSAYCWAAMALRLAANKGGWVLRSFNQPTKVTKIAATTADQPSTGLMAKIKIRKVSATGASINASTTGADKKSRTDRKSFMGWALPPGRRLRLASKMAVKMRPLMRRSKAREASCMTSDRTHSSTSMTTKANSTTTVSMASVM